MVFPTGEGADRISKPFLNYGFTVRVVCPVMLLDVALMVVDCAGFTVAAAVNNPELLIVPAVVLDEFHVALDVMS
jgi:hypothetical protein